MQRITNDALTLRPHLEVAAKEVQRRQKDLRIAKLALEVAKLRKSRLEEHGATLEASPRGPQLELFKS
jgi:hypothetical protein